MEILQRDLRCHFCNQNFLKRTILKRHYREKHFCGNLYQCNMCMVSFVRKERLIRHLKSVHFNLKYECGECDMKFVEKYKHNHHLVHCHGYAYCANCKVAYRRTKSLDRNELRDDDNSDARTLYNEVEHICNNYVYFFKCSLGNCKSRKRYNRLNFYIRHLQCEHALADFTNIKENIEQNTYEMRKPKRKTGIRAKTLEGHVEDVVNEELIEMFDYARYNFAEIDMNEANLSPNEILRKLKQKHAIDECKQEPRDRVSLDVRNIKDEQDFKVREDNRINFDNNMECKGDYSLKELMQNINIKCMMENNHRKQFNNKISENEDIISRNIDNDTIQLGKRGRPAKKTYTKNESLAETVVGSYLNKMEMIPNVKKVEVKRSEFDFPEKDSKDMKNKEKKKIKSVYFDDILMEMMTITQKVKNKKQIFIVKRSDLVFVMNNEPVTRTSPIPFLPVKNVFIELETERNNAIFDQLKQIQRAQLRNPETMSVSKKADRPKGMVETYLCYYCDKEFFNYNGYHQHLQSVHYK